MELTFASGLAFGAGLTTGALIVYVVTSIITAILGALGK